MHELLGLSNEQIVSIGTAIGVAIGAIVTAIYGYRSDRSQQQQVAIPMAAIPPEIVEAIDRIENRCTHIEHKTDVLDDKVDRIFTDTQVLRDRGRTP